MGTALSWRIKRALQPVAVPPVMTAYLPCRRRRDGFQRLGQISGEQGAGRGSAGGRRVWQEQTVL